MKKANRYYKYGDYHNAVKYYHRAANLKKGNVKVTYMLGLAYLAGDNKTEALKYLETVYKLDPKVDADMEYHLGLAYQYHNRFDEAIAAFKRYKDRHRKRTFIADHKIDQCMLGDSLIRHSAGIEVRNAGMNINSPYNDYTPLIFDNGQSLIFTSNRAGSTGGLRLSDGSYYEDIYISHRDGNDWDKPQKIGSGINLKYHDAAASISPDGKTLFLYYEKGGGDIYTSKFENNEWTTPEPLSKHINSVFWETAASITADGKTIYFTSNRPGGIGDLDIYRSELDENGEWGPAQNLGPTINTPASEDAPFIHPDGKTLYFGSTGHLGMGGSDIFYSQLVDGKFQEPVNMGYPINTVFNDNYFVITPDRKEAYYTSLRSGGTGMADIYYANMDVPEPIKQEPAITEEIIAELPVSPKELIADAGDPEPMLDDNTEEATTKYYDEGFMQLQKDLGVVTVLRGKVIDATTAKPLFAKLKLMNNETNILVAEVDSDPETGEFELVIPHGGNYGVSTSKIGYLFNSINFNLPAFHDYQEVDTHVLLQKAKVGSKVILKNIFFDTGKADLRTESLAELDRIKELLLDNGSLQVQINGHTDNVGNAVYNKILSKKRAQAVVDYLVARGIPGGRLFAKGFGEERPLVSNDDEKDGREINRRTEIEIIGMGESLAVNE
ncbi:outer membrane protein, OmpA/MotB family [Fulvivirga imtechensis AK7]|uniref:Outer membrane protein, OmpA/MotB family n=2 Tax=Fulvivirga TaxID=396811 RepID=L8JWW3_9BACT|nr:outer membrane protein, OmpA/MotB family [Fulvivirga imtechensis AK7]